MQVLVTSWFCGFCGWGGGAECNVFFLGLAPSIDSLQKFGRISAGPLNRSDEAQLVTTARWHGMT